ncbi:MAG: hypothetical protein JXQ73_33590 [Phycisphaerae bacterium]|nr:hypothetical protein [Phycisphaerae bacterium]
MLARTRSMTSAFLLLAAAPIALATQAIESFENETFPAVIPTACKAERVRDHATDGQWALKVVFPGSDKDTWPGLSVAPPPGSLDPNGIFAFDIYNPHDEPVSLSYRIDDAGGKKTFGGQTLGEKTTTKVEIWLPHLADKLSPETITRFFPYIRIPREDRTLYFDHFRLEQRTDRFARLAYLEIARPEEPTSQDRDLGCVLFHRIELAHVFPTSVPWPDEKMECLTLLAAKGQTLSTCLSFRTIRPLDRVGLALSPLKSKTATLSDKTVELARVRRLDKKVTYSSKEYIASLPVYAEPGDAFDRLPASVAETFWIRLRIPDNASPGLYEAQFTVRTRGDRGEAKRVLPLRLRILPFALPRPKDHFIGEYYRAAQQPSDEAWLQTVTADLADMRDHGMTSIGLCFGLDTTRVTLNDGQVDLALDGATRFEQFIQAYVKLGFTRPIVVLADSGQAVAAKAGPYGSPEYDQAYKAFWQTVQKTFKSKGWPELIVQPVDEPAWQSKERKDRNVHLLRLLKQIPGMRTEQDGPGDAYFRDVAGPFADMWNYNGGIDPFDQIPQIRKNHLVCFYNNDVESYRPEVDRYVSGFFQIAAGIDGVFNWEYRGGRGSLYDDFDGKTGDWVHNYPPSKTSMGGPSLAWEAAREGVNDLRYVLSLNEWLATARRNPQAVAVVKRAEQRLAYLIESLEATPRVRGRAQWSARLSRAHAAEISAASTSSALDPDAAVFLCGVLKHPNGWTLRDYARARWAVALSVLELMAACGQDVEIPSAAVSGQPTLVLAGVTTYPENRKSTRKNASDKAVTLVPRLSQAPKLDGRLDDPAWKQSFHIPRFVTNMGLNAIKPAEQTEAYLGWHDRTLYVGVCCKEPTLGGLVINCQEDGEPTWSDDCVELFFDPGRSRSRFSQLVFNPKGVQFSKTPSDHPWDVRVPVATARGRDEWRVEAAVPLDKILEGRADLGFNVARERKAGGGNDLSCWRPTGSQFGNPSAFAHLRFDKAEQLALSASPTRESKLRITSADALALCRDHLAFEAEWTGDKPTLVGCRLRVRLLSDNKTVAAAQVPAPLAPRSKVVLEMRDVVPGAHRIDVSLVQADGSPVEDANAAKNCLVIQNDLE